MVGKDQQSGGVGSILTDEGLNPNDQLRYFCKNYSQSFSATGLVIVNLATDGISDIANVSQLAAGIAVDGRSVASNYNIASNTGGFSVTSNATETVGPGVRPIRICTAARGVSNWRATYSVSIIQ